MLKLTFILNVLCVVLAASSPKLPVPDNLGIVGGVNANIANFPWQISLQLSGRHVCGGFLISNTWVVTAAHCIFPGYHNHYNIRAGSNRWKGGQRINVARIIVHPNYRESNYNNDIAVLQLESPVTNAVARAAVLPAAGVTVPAGASLTITGWGATFEGGSSSLFLQQVTVPTISRVACRNAYSASMVTTNMFCAGLVGIGGKDSCQGDSGGPAVINGVVVGVVSWGYGCAQPSYPGVYVKVSSYRAWIRQATGI